MAIKRCPWHAETLDPGTDLYRQMTEIFALREMVARFDDASLFIAEAGTPGRSRRPVFESKAPPAHARRAKLKNRVDRPGR